MNDDLRLMFLASHNFDSGKAFRGAFLLTDGATKPLEFRCTTPIRPSSLQVVLYGDILEQHMLVELIGKPLIDQAHERPDLIIVNQSGFLALRPHIDYPLVQITKEERIEFSDTNESRFEFLNSPSGRFDPVVITTHSEFVEDKQTAGEILSEIFNHHDLTEPFGRIESAVDQVHQQRSMTSNES